MLTDSIPHHLESFGPCRYVNDKRLASNEKRHLREGDIVSFGGSSLVKSAPGRPDEANPYMFRVKWLNRVFESNAVQDRAVQSLEETQRTASNLQGDCIDLTVSMLACYLCFLQSVRHRAFNLSRRSMQSKVQIIVSHDRCQTIARQRCVHSSQH